jgi:hypothetical protein
MAKESSEAKRARKAAAKEVARARAALIAAGDIPGYLRQSSAATRPPKSRHKVVQAPPDRAAKALIPPTDTKLRPREREQYADNAPRVWVRGERHAQDD